jgi:protein-tyrosine-phosphatase
MAQAFAEKYGIESLSAGTVPSTRLNPTVVEAMREKGLDVSKRTPRMLTSEMIDEASLVVTMGCSVAEVCPKPMIAQMQKKLVDWALPDPKDQPIEKVREIRDEIERRVLELKTRTISM